MYTTVAILIIIASILLILIVLVQNSKGGGLVSNFSASNQIMGVRKTADFLEQATWGLAIAILVLSIVASMAIPRDTGKQRDTILKDNIENAPEIPVLPTAPPANSNDNNQ